MRNLYYKQQAKHSIRHIARTSTYVNVFLLLLKSDSLSRLVVQPAALTSNEQ